MHLDLIADLIDCEVRTEIPLSGAWGEYDPALHAIRLHPSLTGMHRDAVLGHELGHAAHKHTGYCPREESEADRFAQWLTIPLCGFLRAVREQEDMLSVAYELGVLPSGARAYAKRF